jgi:2-dehydro-3-deoxygluconokinase
MTKVACIGECMIELKQAQGGLYSRGYGGDTLNTANYLARLGYHASSSGTSGSQRKRILAKSR